ncbi:flavin reductase family protein [Pueribacillus sp. YX66]|uniref:flavin reductase family protein n=1 Tax=Pueribacillus sp. YX66 TaxID=3229242 RepID=UPI00358D53C2
MDNTTFRNAMSKFATGITVVTTEIDDRAHGMTVNAFMSVSLDPKLVVVSIDKKAGMLSLLQKAKKYAVSILNNEQQEYSMIFAGQMKDKQAVDFERINGLPVLKDAVVTLTCDVYEEHEVGDHILFFGEVTGGEVKEREPLVYFNRKYGEFRAE